eukprot:705194-Prorocentrum_minimum.AAC.1
MFRPICLASADTHMCAAQCFCCAASVPCSTRATHPPNQTNLVVDKRKRKKPSLSRRRANRAFRRDPTDPPQAPLQPPSDPPPVMFIVLG